MAGAGGSMYRSVVSLANFDRDIQVTVSLGEHGVTPIAGSEAYRDAVLKFEGVNAIIEKCLTKVSSNLIASLSAGDDKESPVAHPKQQSTPPPLPRRARQVKSLLCLHTRLT